MTIQLIPANEPEEVVQIYDQDLIEGQFFGLQFDEDPWTPPAPEPKQVVVIHQPTSVLDHEFMI